MMFVDFKSETWLPKSVSSPEVKQLTDLHETLYGTLLCKLGIISHRKKTHKRRPEVPNIRTAGSIFLSKDRLNENFPKTQRKRNILGLNFTDFSPQYFSLFLFLNSIFSLSMLVQHFSLCFCVLIIPPPPFLLLLLFATLGISMPQVGFFFCPVRWGSIFLRGHRRGRQWHVHPASLANSIS